MQIERHSIALPGGQFEYLRASGGKPLLVLLHGFPDHPPNFEALLLLLAQGGFDVVAPWLRGYAPSTLEGPYHLDRIAKDVLELATALGHERFYLVGHDWGALATYLACARAAARVEAAVAVSIPHPATFAKRRQLGLSAYIPVLAAPGGAALAAAHDFAFVEWLWRRWSPDLRVEPARREALHACLRASWPAPARYYRALFWPPSLRIGPSLRVRVPLLHLHGDRDGCVDAETGRGQASFFRGPFASETRAGVGHFLALEAPEWVAERALRWFALPHES